MATAPHKAASSTAVPKAEEAEAEVLPPVAAVPDERDTSPRAKSDLTGRRVRAIPATITKNTGNATTIEVRRSDFKSHDIDHATVTWDFRKDKFTVKVGNKPGQISAEAAKYLIENHSGSFELLDEG